MFKKVDPKQSFPHMEEKLVDYWKENKTFEKSMEKPGGEENPKDYVFYDGPPFATGLPHYGHLLAGTLKDTVPRYWTMQGYKIERKWGWDCHGLPIENLIEKDLNINNKKEIVDYGVDKFNNACEASVLKYAEDWKKVVNRMGRWVDMENDYKTMDPEFMESIWWVFKTLHEKGLAYEGKKSMHVCPRCETPISNFEVTLGYKEVKDPSVIWKFKVTDEENTYLLAWTTTPWSTLSTMGLSVNPGATYVKVKAGEEQLIFAKERLEFVMGKVEEYEVVEEFPGTKIIGLEYEPIIPSYKEIPEVKDNPNTYHTYAADYVEIDQGTGIVTINGSYGEIDMEAAKNNGLPVVMDVDMNGEFNEMGGKYQGMFIKDMEKALIQDMEEAGLVWRSEGYKHSYPHCWRCDSPLLSYATSSWFIAVTKIKEQMIKSNQEIHWSPGHLKEGRFGKWLEGAKDWSVSRGRYWGTPIPVWKNVEDENDLIVIGSVEELHALSGVKIDNLHKHIVDEIEFEKGGKTYKRIPEVFDCWMESGSMPYAQLHYPFENKEKFENNFPANFIAEGVDQTRCWFYVLHVLSNGLFGKPAFKNVLVNGTILAEDGKKMSKRLKNYPDPKHVFEKYGADALRFYLLNSQAVMAGDMRFAERGVEQVLRNMMLPIWNAYSFFVTYANIDGWEPGDQKNAGEIPKSRLDRWILAELNQLVAGQIEYFEVYNLQKASNAVYKFVDDLTNWYIRRSRRRFWKSEDDGDKQSAYQTLYTVLKTLAQVLAPFTPFMPEEIYQNLTGEESVHLTAYPKPNKDLYDETLIHEIHLAKNIVSMGLAARSKRKIKVRQPLQKIEVVLADQADHALIQDQLETIKEELNVKEVDFVDDPSLFATRIAKPNAKLLGPKYGKEVQRIIVTAKKGAFEELGNGRIRVSEELLKESEQTQGQHKGSWELEPEEVVIDYLPKEGFDVESEAGILIALDTTITPELKQEGFARDLVRQIQELRKAADYKVDDRIQIALVGVDTDLLEKFGAYIKTETLATSIEEDLVDADKEVEYEGVMVKVKR